MDQKHSGTTGRQPPSHEAIAARAHQIYCERGRQHGHDIDDWLQAEYELLQLPIRKLAELEPPRHRRRLAGKSVVTLVQAALLASSQGLTELLRWR